MFNIFKVITNKNYEIVFLWSRFVLGICVRKCIIKQLPPNKKASDSLRLDHWYKLRDREDKKLILWVAIKDQTKITFWDINGNPLEVRWKMSLFQGWREGNRHITCPGGSCVNLQQATHFRLAHPSAGHGSWLVDCGARMWILTCMSPLLGTREHRPAHYKTKKWMGRKDAPPSLPAAVTGWKSH